VENSGKTHLIFVSTWDFPFKSGFWGESVRNFPKNHISSPGFGIYSLAIG